MKITEIASDCIAIELMKGDVSIQTEKVVALVNPFDLVKKLEQIEVGGLLLLTEWICPEEEALELLEPLEEVLTSTWLPTLIFAGVALATAVIGFFLGLEVGV